MKRTFLIFLMFLILFGCRLSNLEIQNAFSKHQISLMLLSDNELMIAKDTLQINYLDKTNDLYFYLNSSLSVKKVQVGNHNIQFEKINTPPSFTLPAKDSVLYKVELPKSLFPQSIDIWYEGQIPDNREQFHYSDINNNNILLDGKNCWYPTIPGYNSSFSIKTITLDKDSTISCDAKLICSEKNETCFMCYWEQTEPVPYMDFYLPGN